MPAYRSGSGLKAISKTRSKSVSASRPRSRYSFDFETFQVIDYDKLVEDASASGFHVQDTSHSSGAPRSRFLPVFKLGVSKSRGTFSVMEFFGVRSPDFSDITDNSSLEKVIKALEGCSKVINRQHNNVCSLL